jgi:hypothetical protein
MHKDTILNANAVAHFGRNPFLLWQPRHLHEPSKCCWPGCRMRGTVILEVMDGSELPHMNGIGPSYMSIIRGLKQWPLVPFSI